MAISKWNKSPLKPLCNRIGDGLHGTPSYNDESDVFFINGNNLKNGSIVISRETKKVTSSDFESNYIELNENSLLLSINGTLGEMAFYNGEKVMLGKSAAYLNFKTGINRFYYYYFQLKGVQQYFYNVATGSTIKNLGLKSIQDFEVPHPDEKEWQPIARFLSNLDKKIELNNKINTELEAMAKLIYDYWFVQFDFPDANGQPYKSSGGKMVYNETLKREIPDGWDSDYVEHLLEKESRTKKLPKTNYKTEGTIPVIDQSTDFICGYTDDEDTVITTEIPRIVFGDHTRIFKLVNFNFARGADGTQVLLSNNKNVPQHYFYHSLLKIDLTNYGYARHFKFLKSTRIVVPSHKITCQFEEKVKSFYDQIRHNRFENTTLEELRDWLLPMLMNGQVTVNDAPQ